MRLLLLITCAILWLAARPARASGDPTFRSRFSDRGAVLLEGGVSGVWSNDRSAVAYRRHPDYRVTLAPALTYFIADHVGVGAGIGLGFERESGHPEDAVVLTYDVSRRQTFVGCIHCSRCRSQGGRACSCVSAWAGGAFATT